MKGNIISNIINANLEKFKDHEYIFEKKNNSYCSYTYSNFYKDVLKFSSYFKNKGLVGKKIGIFSPNSYNYMVCDVAIMAYTGVAVQLSEIFQIFDLTRIIDKIGLDAIVYDATKKVIIEELKLQNYNLEFISFEDIYSSNEITEVEPLNDIDCECSKIVFSSGTTGIPKAVMLSQKNMFVNLDILLKRANMNSDDICYLFLPLSHTYGGIGNFVYSLYTGMKIYLCSDKNLILQEIQEVKPTVFSAVPILLEKLYLYSKTTGANLKDLLGGKIRFLFCGGAILKPEIRKYFKDNDINLLEAYGLSETSSLISIEYPNKDDFHSVGTIFENQIVKIDNPDKEGIGEILTKGENLFVGYYNDEEKYVNSFTEDGYFKTGDIGYISNNKLFLVGRKKRVLLCSNGRTVDIDELEKNIGEKIKVNKVKIFEENNNVNCIVYSNEYSDKEELLKLIKTITPKFIEVTNCIIVEDNLNNRIK